MGMRPYARTCWELVCGGGLQPGAGGSGVAVAEWLLFFFTGVTVRGRAWAGGGFFFANLALSYLLLRTSRGRAFWLGTEDLAAGVPCGWRSWQSRCW